MSITEAEIKRMVRKCMNHLKLKRYELGLSKIDVDRAVNLTRARRTKNAHANANQIYVGLKPWQAERFIENMPNVKFHFREYAAFRGDKVIGSIECGTIENMMLLIVAHEVSHYVQFRHGPRINRYKSNYRKPHGHCFKDIYRMLRCGLVNPIINTHEKEMK